jgi:NifU-like protein involved in Fe-S cluster formation
MSSPERLYTPELLGLAVELAEYPLRDDLPLRGSARSRSCGSTLDIALAIDDDGRVTEIGMRVRACAVGQAAAAIFARSVIGSTADEITAAGDAIARWLVDGGELPGWPDLEMLAAARDFPGRHGAMMLPWNAARDALCTISSAR